MAALPAAILTMGAIFLPETPSFIIQRDGNTDKVRILLQKLRGTESVQEELTWYISSLFIRTVKHSCKLYLSPCAPCVPINLIDISGTLGDSKRSLAILNLRTSGLYVSSILIIS